MPKPVGYSRAAEEYIDRLTDNPQWGYVAVGILVGNKLCMHSRFLADPHNILQIIVVLQRKGNRYLVQLVLRQNDFQIPKASQHLHPLIQGSGMDVVIPGKPYTEDLMGLPVINIRYVPLTNTGNILIKRVVDILGSVVGILLTSPIMLLAALLVKLYSRMMSTTIPMVFARTMPNTSKRRRTVRLGAYTPLK